MKVRPVNFSSFRFVFEFEILSPPIRQSQTISPKMTNSRDGGAVDGRRRLRSHQKTNTTNSNPLRRSARLHQTKELEADFKKKPKKERKKQNGRDRRENLPEPPAESRIPRRSPRLASRYAEDLKKEKDSDIVEIASSKVAERPLKDELGEKKAISEAKDGKNNKRRVHLVAEEEGKEIGRREGKKLCLGAQEGWTEEQEKALRRAYLLAKPSPHFWRKVSKLVPGKSDYECFNRIHADLTTPPPVQPRSRAKKTNLSPINSFSLSDISIDLTEKNAKRARSCKQRSLAAHKTVRHLLRKHCIVDQAKESDHFKILETSQSSLTLQLPEIGSPLPPSFIRKCNEKSSSAQKAILSRIETNRPDHPSPNVLKRVKNIALHEKYIDRLHTREARRRVGPNTTSSNTAIYGKTTLKAARAALLTEAREAISHFHQAQSNLESHSSDSDFVSGSSNDLDDEI